MLDSETFLTMGQLILLTEHNTDKLERHSSVFLFYCLSKSTVNILLPSVFSCLRVGGGGELLLLVHRNIP